MTKICIAIIETNDSTFPTVLAANTNPALVGRIKDFFHKNCTFPLANSFNNDLQDWRRSGIPDSHFEQDVVSRTFERTSSPDVKYCVSIHTGVDL